MLENYLAHQIFTKTPSSSAGVVAYTANRALSLYRKASRRGAIAGLLDRFNGHASGLLDLQSIETTNPLRGQRYAGARTVALESIVGSESRTQDFDRNFHPLGSHDRSRWLGIAIARLQGVGLPPVSLIQVGERYFVRDGHHRISVARALGELYIEAEVTEHTLAAPLPWETATGTCIDGLMPA